MFKRLLQPGVLSLLAATALLLIPSVSQAQWGRGGYSGGRGGVGYSYGGSPYYGNYGNWGYGGYRPYYSGGYYPGNYGSNWGYYPRTYYGRSYYPNNYYYNNYYSNDYYTATPNVTGYQSFYPSEGVTGATSATPGQSDRTVYIAVRVPADAEVWFGDFKTNVTGTERSFVSPPLDPDKNYTYDIRARWNENGRAIDRTRTLQVHAGDRLNVDFLNYTQSDPTPASEAKPVARPAGFQSTPPVNPTTPRVDTTKPPPPPQPQQP